MDLRGLIMSLPMIKIRKSDVSSFPKGRLNCLVLKIEKDVFDMLSVKFLESKIGHLPCPFIGQLLTFTCGNI